MAQNPARKLTDADIRQALIDAFVHDTPVLSWNRDVTVYGGVVTLRGR